MGKLTDVQLRNWIKTGKPVAIADGEGLTFTLSTKGTAAWTLRYRVAGKPKELTRIFHKEGSADQPKGALIQVLKPY